MKIVLPFSARAGALSRARIPREVLLIIAVTGVAALLRLLLLTEIPPGMHGDEAVTAMEAQRYLDEGYTGVWSTSIHGQPGGPFYWVAFWWLLLPQTLFTIRLTTALLGIAAIPVFYLFCREMFGARAALVGAILLAVSHWAIHFSRTAFPLAAVPVVELAGLYFLARAARTGRWWSYLAGGALIGAGIYTYGSYFFLPPMIAIAMLTLLWGSRSNRAAFRRNAAGLGLAGAAALIAAGPYLFFAYQNQDEVFSASMMMRIDDTDLFRQAGPGGQAKILFNRSFDALAVYFRGGQQDEVDGLGIRGLLDPVSVFLLAVGLIVALRRPLDWRHALIVCGIIAGALPVVLMTPSYRPPEMSAEYRRNIIAMPFIFAGAGLGADVLLSLAARWKAWRPQAVQYGAMGALVLALMAAAAAHIHYYFVQWPREPSTRWVFAYDLLQAAHYLEKLEGGEPTVYFYSSRWPYDYPTLRYLLPGYPGEDRSTQFGQFTLDRNPQDQDAVYVFMEEYTRYLPDVKERYPGGVVTEDRDENGNLIFAAYYLPHEERLADRK